MVGKFNLRSFLSKAPDNRSPRPRNDILRKHGIIPEKPQDPEPLIQEALVEAERKAHENRLEDKDLDELHDLEDEEDEEFLEQYRYVANHESSGILGCGLWAFKN